MFDLYQSIGFLFLQRRVMPAALLFTIHYNKGNKLNLPALFKPNKTLLCRLAIEFFASRSCEGRCKQGLQKWPRKIHRPWLHTQRGKAMRQMIFGKIVRKKQRKKYLKFVNERKASLTFLVQEKSKGERSEQKVSDCLLHCFLWSYNNKNLWCKHTSSLHSRQWPSGTENTRQI